MQRRVRSVRVPEELSRLDLSGLVRECELCLRDIESAALLQQAGNREAAEALIRARQGDLGRKVGRLVLDARTRRLEELRAAARPDVPGPAAGREAREVPA